MLFNQENCPPLGGYNESYGISPLYHALSASAHLRVKASRVRAPLQNRTNLSPSVDQYSPEDFDTLPHKIVHNNHGSRFFFKDNDSFLSPSDFLKNQRHAKHSFKGFSLRKEIISPMAVEPESSSSQPSEPYSGSYGERSPFYRQGEVLQKKNNRDNIFTDAFYKKINDFLDLEELDIVDPNEHFRNLIHFPRFTITRNVTGSEDLEIESGPTGVKSATESPKLISDHINGSSLYQRRASRSQGPEVNKASGEDSCHVGLRLLNIKHFRDDVNQILMAASPIEEKDTPILSRNNSGFQENTPGRLITKKLTFKRLLSPDTKWNKTPDHSRCKNGLKRYTLDSLQILKSCVIEKNQLHDFNEFSPYSNLKEEKGSSVGNSPTIPFLRTVSENKDSLMLKKGVTVKKSQFQKLRRQQEFSPMM